MPSRTPEKQAEIAAFDLAVSTSYRAGHSINEVARVFECSQGKIAHSLRRSKTPMRQSGRRSG